MAARKTQGSEIALEQTTVDDLRARLRGQLLLPDDPGYDEARSVWNARIDRHPALIAGFAVCDGGMMLDMSLMRGVSQAKVAHVQAGCLIGDVDRETQTRGLTTVLGFISLTGIAGLTLGGSFWLPDRANSRSPAGTCKSTPVHHICPITQPSDIGQRNGGTDISWIG